MNIRQWEIKNHYVDFSFNNESEIIDFKAKLEALAEKHDSTVDFDGHVLSVGPFSTFDSALNYKSDASKLIS